MTLLPMAWADYFGRESYGAIRGVALSLQVLAQAAGPVASGLLRDASGTYTSSLILFGVLAALAAIIAVLARHPRPITA
jgi:MFS transporter, OFA family, oxalate/formate antiporter